MVNVDSPCVLSSDEVLELRNIQKQKQAVKSAILSLKWREAQSFLGSNAVLENSIIGSEEVYVDCFL